MSRCKHYLCSSSPFSFILFFTEQVLAREEEKKEEEETPPPEQQHLRHLIATSLTEKMKELQVNS